MLSSRSINASSSRTGSSGWTGPGWGLGVGVGAMLRDVVVDVLLVGAVYVLVGGVYVL